MKGSKATRRTKKMMKATKKMTKRTKKRTKNAMIMAIKSVMTRNSKVKRRGKRESMSLPKGPKFIQHQRPQRIHQHPRLESQNPYKETEITPRCICGT